MALSVWIAKKEMLPSLPTALHVHLLFILIIKFANLANLFPISIIPPQP